MEAASASASAATMVFVYGTLKRGFPNHPRLAAFNCPFAGAASTAAPASLVIGPYSVPFLLPTPTSSSGRLVSGELYSASPSAVADLDLLEGTHLGVYERRRITVVVDGATKEVEAEAYFANASYAEALWLRCGGEAAEIAEYTMEHAGRAILYQQTIHVIFFTLDEQFRSYVFFKVDVPRFCSTIEQSEANTSTSISPTHVLPPNRIYRSRSPPY